MTDRPYTDEDLRAEAARQLSVHGPGTSPEQVYTAMLDAIVESTDDGTCSRQTWNELLVAATPNDEWDAYSEAKQKVHDLINGAADISEWAVNLGADGLEPDGHTLQLGSKEAGDDDSEMPFVRMHFAFHPDATDAERDRFVMELSKVVARNL